jgi:hypothetical protein
METLKKYRAHDGYAVADRKDHNMRFMHEPYTFCRQRTVDRVQLFEAGDGFYIDARNHPRCRNIDKDDYRVVTAATPPNA